MSATKLKYKHIRFLGAEGIGMSALITILEQQKSLGIVDPDLKISRSDLSYPSNDPLDKDIDLVVRSTAISDTDPDLVELQSRGLEIWHRSGMLNYLSQGYKQIVVSGTHGKTTCSAMLAHVLIENGLDPCFAIGGILQNYDSNGRAGQGEYFILEGDESDKSFTKTKPYLAMVTSIEPDHLENYPGGIEEIQVCFDKFLADAQIKVVNQDIPTPTVITSDSEAIPQLHTYSKEDTATLDLDMPTHNLLNAAGVITAATQLGITREAAIQALSSFKGIKRRFELINPNYNGIKVYDDYAHHPTEIKALLEGALSLNPKRLVMVYQPHHPERTQQFWDDFVAVFKGFPEEHLCLIADIYVARSKHIEGINSKRLAEEIAKPNVRYLESLKTETTSQGNYLDMTGALKPGIDAELEGCDYLFIVGAGDIYKLADNFRPAA